MWHKFLFYFSVLLTTTALLACSNSPTPQYTVSATDQYIKEKKYFKAKKILDKLSQDGKASSEITRQIKLLDNISQLEIKNILTKVKELTKKGELIEAKKELKLALKEFPKNRKLTDQAYTIDEMIDNKVTTLKIHRDLINIHHYLEVSDLNNRLKKITGPSENNKIKSFKKNRKEKNLSKKMLKCADYSLGKNNYELAEKCLTLSKNLTRTEETDEKLAIILAKKEKRNIGKALTSQKLATLKNQYRNQLKLKYWASAKSTLSQLRKFSPNNDEYITWSNSLKQSIQTKVEDDITLGRLLYSSGEVNQALAIWQKAASLSPQNEELQFHIDRAERFLENYRRLKTKNQ